MLSSVMIVMTVTMMDVTGTTTDVTAIGGTATDAGIINNKEL